MANSFIASTQVTNQNGTAARQVQNFLKDTGAGSDNLAPADLALDDVIIFCISKAATSNTPITAPTAGSFTTSFAMIGTSTFADGSTTDTLQNIWAAKLTSLPTAVTDVLGTIASSGGSTLAQATIGYILRGVDYANLIALTGDAQRVNATGTGTTVANPASATPTGTGPWILVFGSGSTTSSITAYTMPAGLATTQNHWRVSNNNTPTQKTGVGAGFKEDWTSGAFDCPVFGGGTVNAGASWAAATIIIPAAATGGKMKVWNGSAWVEKPVKVWNGSVWVAKPLKVWNGSAWVLS